MKEVFDAVQRQVTFEIGRQTRLDTKASSLLGATGLSLTVAFTFGGQILLNNADVLGEFGVIGVVADSVFVLAVVSGLVSASYALRALFVRGSATASPDELFKKSVLAIDSDEDLEDEDKAAHYQRHLAVHLWDVAEALSERLSATARYVRTGQAWLVVFIALLGLISLLIAGGVAWKSLQQKAPAPKAVMGTDAQPPSQLGSVSARPAEQVRTATSALHR